MAESKYLCREPNVGLSANKTFAVSHAPRLSAKRKPARAKELSANYDISAYMITCHRRRVGRLTAVNVFAVSLHGAHGKGMFAESRGRPLGKIGHVARHHLFAEILPETLGKGTALGKEALYRERPGGSRQTASRRAHGKQGVCRELGLVALGKEVFAERFRRSSRQTTLGKAGVCQIYALFAESQVFAESLDLALGKRLLCQEPDLCSRQTGHHAARPSSSLTLTVIDASRIASTQNFDGRVVMEVGGGKKHGRYWMGDSTPRDSAKGAERKRHNPPTHDTGAAADIVSTERTERESLQANLTQMYAWMQSVGTQVSVPPPQLQFQPPPRQPTPGLSAGSNDPAGMVNMSPGVSPTARVSDWSPWGTQQDGQGSQDRDLSNPSQAHNPLSAKMPFFAESPSQGSRQRCHFLPRALAKALGKAPVQRPRACPPMWAPWVLCREPGSWLSANPAAGPTETAQRRLAGSLHALGKYLLCTRQTLCREPGRKLSAKVASPRKSLPSQLCREPALGKAFAERMSLFAESSRLTAKSLDPVCRFGSGNRAVLQPDRDGLVGNRSNRTGSQRLGEPCPSPHKWCSIHGSAPLSFITKLKISEPATNLPRPGWMVTDGWPACGSNVRPGVAYSSAFSPESICRVRWFGGELHASSRDYYHCRAVSLSNCFRAPDGDGSLSQPQESTRVRMPTSPAVLPF
nr:unnamed protein product [Digitaria exilis]